MSGCPHPKSYCDYECAAMNGCTVGGYACAGCGDYYCANELDEDGYCDRCAEEIRKEEEEAEEEE